MLKRAAEQPEGREHKASRSKGAGKDKEKDSDKLQALVGVVARLSLAHAAEIRDLQGAVFHAFLLQAASLLSQALTEVGKRYHDEAAKDPKGHNLGPPFLHTWVTLVQHLKDEENVAKAVRKTLAEYWEEVVLKRPREELEAHIRHCRVRPAYKKEKMKLHIMISPSVAPRLEEPILQAIIQCGGEKKVGAPPPGGLEREARELLQRLG